MSAPGDSADRGAFDGEALDGEARALVALSAALAARVAAGSQERSAALESALDRAAAAARPRAVEEALIQSYLFLGYPAALNALRGWRERSPLPAAPAADDDWPAWAERGERVCATVYGGQYRRLRENVRALHPDMERWMLVEGYGKVLGRPGLTLEVRELCIGALLSGLDAPAQLFAHLRGALNAGATPERVEAALSEAERFHPRERMEEAWRVWSGVRARAREGKTPGAS